ncbi:MAG: hypothetical protein J6W23_14465 [Victivallales bacterium]|nr:hypothetical protein [Victivallales bacterium]MBO7533722.1 hypothetical protein [Victivallales bacterium]
MVAPLFRAGDEASKIRHPVWKTELRDLSPSRRLRLPDEGRPPDGWTSADSSPRPEGRGYRK